MFCVCVEGVGGRGGGGVEERKPFFKKFTGHNLLKVEIGIHKSHIGMPPKDVT